MNTLKTFRGELSRIHDIEYGEKNGKQWSRQTFTIADNSNPNFSKIMAFTSMNGRCDLSNIPIRAMVEVAAYCEDSYSKNQTTGKEFYFSSNKAWTIQRVDIQQTQPQNQYAPPQQGYAPTQKVVTPQRSDDDSESLPF